MNTEVRFKMMGIVQSILKNQQPTKNNLSDKLWHREKENTKKLLQLVELLNMITMNNYLQHAPSREKTITYLVDVKGYSVDDAKTISWEMLEEKDKVECILYSI